MDELVMLKGRNLIRGVSHSFFLMALFLNISCTKSDPVVEQNSSPRSSLEDGLVAYYPLNGNALDASGSGFHGTNSGAIPAADRLEIVNGACSFDGSSAYIRCGDILDTLFAKPRTKFTISGWARTRTPGMPDSNHGVIVTKGIFSGNTGPYQFFIGHFQLHGEPRLYAGIYYDSIPGFRSETISRAVGTNEWFQFVFIFDGEDSLQIAPGYFTKLRLFVNGNFSPDSCSFSSSGSSRGTSTENTCQELTIGAGHRPGQPTMPVGTFDGDIDDLRIYSRILSNQEIHALQVYKGDH